MPDSAKIAVVAALEREVRPLVKEWHEEKREHGGYELKFFEKDQVILVCAGIGAEAARRATEAIIHFYRPVLIQSVGFAGALDPALKVGNIFIPGSVIDGNDGSKIQTRFDTGALVSVSSIAGATQKAELRRVFGAGAIDMEASAVARVAQSHGIPFVAVKSISDEYDFEVPAMERFVGPDGHFRSLAFVASVLIRPWLWGKTLKLARNSAKAADSLCKWLDEHNHGPEKVENTGRELHPMEGAPPATRV